MAKTKRDSRQKRDKRSREPREFGEHVLQIARVTRVVKGGRRMRFRAAVIIGNHKGKVGLGLGKAGEVRTAVEKATAQAKRRMIRVPIVNGTIPHGLDIKFKAAKLRLIPAAEGTGIIAGGALRPILELAGVKNVLSKRYGSGNVLVNAQAAMLALSRLKAVKGGIEEEEKGEAAVSIEGVDDLIEESVQDAEARGGLKVTEVAETNQ